MNLRWRMLVSGLLLAAAVACSAPNTNRAVAPAPPANGHVTNPNSAQAELGIAISARRAPRTPTRRFTHQGCGTRLRRNMSGRGTCSKRFGPDTRPHDRAQCCANAAGKPARHGHR